MAKRASKAKASKKKTAKTSQSSSAKRKKSGAKSSSTKSRSTKSRTVKRRSSAEKKSAKRKSGERGKKAAQRKPATSSKSLKAGDRVSWGTSQGKTQGRVVKKQTTPTQIKGHKVAASHDNPEYIVESAKSGKRAAHKPAELRKIG